MPEDNKMMASFRIDREDWNRFGELARMERLTATQLLTDYVAWCLERGKSQYGVRQDNDTSSRTFSTGNDDVTQMLEDRLSTHKDEVLTAVADKISMLSVSSVPSGEAIAPLTQSIEGLRETLNELESYMMGNFEGLRESVKKLEESQLKRAQTAPSGETHSQTNLFEGNSPTLKPSKPDGAITIPSGDISASGVGTSNPVNSKVKKFLELPESDRAEVIRLLGDGIPAPERNDGMTAIFGWSADKSDKSKGEDCSRLKKHLKAEGLL
jgi:hypothetical protein